MAYGDYYFNSTTTNMYITTSNSNTLTYTQNVPINNYTITTGSTLHTTTFNGDPFMKSTIFQTMEERIEYQQQAHLEPRDHSYAPKHEGEMCQDCYPHNLHRFSPEKHLFVIDEEIPWCDRLAS